MKFCTYKQIATVAIRLIETQTKLGEIKANKGSKCYETPQQSQRNCGVILNTYSMKQKTVNDENSRNIIYIMNTKQTAFNFRELVNKKLANQVSWKMLYHPSQ